MLIKNLFVVGLVCSLSGCGSDDASTSPDLGEGITDPGDTDTDSGSGTDTDTGTTYTGVPYDYTRYQDALNAANLQQTDSDVITNQSSTAKSDVVSAGGYEGYASDYFYIDADSGWLTFEMYGDSHRTELRFAENFRSNLSDTSYTMTAEVLPISPAESVAASSDGKEITILQVHNKGTSGSTDDTVLSHPLLRIVWDGESRTDAVTGDSYTNAYWGILKTNA